MKLTTDWMDGGRDTRNGNNSNLLIAAEVVVNHNSIGMVMGSGCILAHAKNGRTYGQTYGRTNG